MMRLLFSIVIGVVIKKTNAVEDPATVYVVSSSICGLEPPHSIELRSLVKNIFFDCTLNRRQLKMKLWNYNPDLLLRPTRISPTSTDVRIEASSFIDAMDLKKFQSACCAQLAQTSQDFMTTIRPIMRNLASMDSGIRNDDVYKELLVFDFCNFTSVFSDNLFTLSQMMVNQFSIISRLQLVGLDDLLYANGTLLDRLTSPPFRKTTHTLSPNQTVDVMGFREPDDINKGFLTPCNLYRETPPVQGRTWEDYVLTALVGTSVPAVLFCVIMWCCCCQYRRKTRALQQAVQSAHTNAHHAAAATHARQTLVSTIPLQHHPLDHSTIDAHLVKTNVSQSHLPEDPWEISPTLLQIFTDNKLGSGAFGSVYKGKIAGLAPVNSEELHGLSLSDTFRDCDVAVKMLPEHADDIAKSDFFQEINFMKTLRFHRHLVNMLGCRINVYPVCLVVEYCSDGDLLKFVRSRKKEILDQETNSVNCSRMKDLVSFSWQVADGMVYLSQMGCIHRDLAARNILIDKKRTAKIGDFGLCRLLDRDIYQARGGRMPIKYMAIEAIKDCKFSIKSDVWSYGVVLFETFSFGKVPYPSVQPVDMIALLESGQRADPGDTCPPEMLELMSKCWRAEPAERPSFTELKEMLSLTLQNSDETYGYLRLRSSIDSEQQAHDQPPAHTLSVGLSKDTSPNPPCNGDTAEPVAEEPAEIKEGAMLTLDLTTECR